MAQTTFTVEYHSHPDRAGRQHFSIHWEQDGRKRAQHYRMNVAEFAKREEERGNKVVLPKKPYNGMER